jgi:tetratricopeptide (TPR) repeat protein
MGEGDRDAERQIDYYSAAITTKAHFGTLNNRGNAYRALGQDERAIEDYDRAIDLNPEDATAYNNRGYASIALGEPEQALQDIQQALDISRELGDREGEGNYLDSLGEVHAALGKEEEAAAYFEEALAILEEMDSPIAQDVRAHLDELVSRRRPG